MTEYIRIYKLKRCHLFLLISFGMVTVQNLSTFNVIYWTNHEFMPWSRSNFEQES